MITKEKQKDALLEYNLRKRAVTKTNSTAAVWIQTYYKEIQEVIKNENKKYLNYY